MNEELIANVVLKVLNETGKRTAMSLKLAALLAERIEKRAGELDMRVVTAVCDEAGRTKLVRSMDDAYIGSVDVAVNKAFTSVAFKMSTAALGELAQPGASLYGIQFTNEGRIVIFGGGEPLTVDGRIIGGLGVSGGTAEQDTALAAYGASVLKEVITCL